MLKMEENGEIFQRKLKLIQDYLYSLNKEKGYNSNKINIFTYMKIHLQLKLL